MWKEGEAEGGRGRPGWTMLGKTMKGKILYRFDQIWLGDKEQRSLEEPCNDLIVGTLLEERSERRRRIAQTVYVLKRRYINFPLYYMTLRFVSHCWLLELLRCS